MRAFAKVFAAATCLVACADQADSPTAVKDLRVLAIVAEPPEVLFDRANGFSAPQVTFSALLVDPRGGAPATFQWQFCPVDSTQACADFAKQRDLTPITMRPALDALFAPLLEGRAVDAPENGIGAQHLDAFPSAWPTDLFSYHLLNSGLGLGNGAWPSAILSINSNGNQLVVQKRVTLNAADLAEWNDELGPAFGFTVCEAIAPAPGCLPLRPRTANGNPQIVGIGVARGKQAGLPFVPLESELDMHVNEVVRLAPMLSPTAFEAYQSVESTLQDDKIIIRELNETPVVSWFATDGEFGNALTAPTLTKTFDNTFTAPEVPPAATGGVVSLWLVVRDQRGGTGWRQLQIHVLP
jgi:hypothetical protein